MGMSRATVETDTLTPDLLRTVSDSTLIDGIIRLTHRIEASSRARYAELDRTADLRAQRDLIRTELLRRLGASS